MAAQLASSAVMAPVARRVPQARRRAPSSRNPRATVCMAGYDSVQARREAESLRVDSRTKQIHSLAELDAAMRALPFPGAAAASVETRGGPLSGGEEVGDGGRQQEYTAPVR